MLPESELSQIPNGWYLGRPDEFSEKASKFKHTDESKKTISDKIKGNVCYTNGIKNVKIYPDKGETPPKGYDKTKKG